MQCEILFLFKLKERAESTGRALLPRTVGYQNLEIGPLSMGEARAAQDAALSAAAAAICGQPSIGRPLFSIASEESVSELPAVSDGQFGAPNFFDWGPTDYESLEMSVFRHSFYPDGPAILPVGPSETVDVTVRK
jgi:hypothetical protein